MIKFELIDGEEERQFYKDVRDILENARSNAYMMANDIMTYAYWNVGKRIVEQELKGSAKAKYGSYIIKRLAQELSDQYGTGFSIANIKNCRQLYVTFPQDSFGYSMIGKVHWSHLRTIMRLEDEKERNFYLKETATECWSVRELERNIKSGYYKRILSTQFPDKAGQVPRFVKDPYVLEFMGIKDNEKIVEKNVENAIISHLQKFLLEMGKGFCFVDRQMHICTETTDFYIDLVFYNYILKCFVLIDLKTHKLTHQDIGQMDMYIRMFDDLKKQEDDNPTIGIIFCTDKDETMVKYSVLNESEQIFASKYMTVLPTVEELRNELERNQLLYGEELKDN
ncbi:MAG: PDDEXK nuclease domain-containing protein [Lachnospiraceae bacterium]|nr:PDDEXK nuclease domain-containing protein [Lachnospiraceae bacterium]